MSIFEKYYAGQYIVDFVNKTSKQIMSERLQTKAETVQSDIVGNYPRSKFPSRGISEKLFYPNRL